jgi:hypothetical protein
MTEQGTKFGTQINSLQTKGVAKVKGERSSRESGTRRAEERMSQLRAGAYTSSSNPLDIPPEWVEEGWVYGWGRASTVGEPDNNRLAQLAAEGWTPVPVERHPQMMLMGVSFRNEYLNGYIHRGGLILFERPLEWHQEQLRALHEYTNRVIATMPGYQGVESRDGIMANPMIDPTGQSSLRRTLAVERGGW